MTNKTEVAAISLLSQESEENFNFVLSLFRSLYNKNDLIFLVDEDFTCIKSIKQAYPNSTVLLCIFHAIKFLRTLFATALATVEKKEEIMANFKLLLYAHDPESFNVANENFLKLCVDVEVRSNDKYVNLSEYFKKNWSSCTHMWAKHLRKGLSTLGDHTTNRVERIFWTLKRLIREKFVSLRR